MDQVILRVPVRRWVRNACRLMARPRRSCGSRRGSPGSALSTLTAGVANFAVANGLLVAGLQYLQVTFRDGSPLGGDEVQSPGAGAECVLVGGRTAATWERPEGFSLIFPDRNACENGLRGLSRFDSLARSGLGARTASMFRDGSSPRAHAPIGRCHFRFPIVFRIHASRRPAYSGWYSGPPSTALSPAFGHAEDGIVVRCSRLRRRSPFVQCSGSPLNFATFIWKT